MDPQQNDSSGWNTLAQVLAGGAMGYLDSQAGQPVYAVAPAPQTAYGYAGYGQPTPSAFASAQAPGWLWIGGLVLVGFLILRR